METLLLRRRLLKFWPLQYCEDLRLNSKSKLRRRMFIFWHVFHFYDVRVRVI